MIKFNGDIDLDFGNRTAALSYLRHVDASMTKTDGSTSRHNTGVYFTDIPHDAHNLATIDYKAAEDRGYFKVDFLNVSVYEQVRSEEHLIRLMTTEPKWERLLEKEFCEQLIHIGGYWSTITALSEPIDSIPRLAMCIAAIRPAKKHLLGKAWNDVAKTIWEKPTNGEYYFKKAHSVSYAHLIVVHMNLLDGL